MVVELPLTKGMFALLDEQDKKLTTCRWRAVNIGRNWYAVRTTGKKLGRRIVYLHRVVLGFQDLETGENLIPGVEVDHVNGDGLDNRRSNLRPATRAQNARNGRSRRDGYRGVYRVGERWKAQISRCLGYFDTPEEAALAYDAAARKFHREFAHLNFPEKGVSDA